MAYTVEYGQSIFDISVQVYGSADGVEQLLRDNPEIDLDTDLVVGQVLVTDSSNIEDNDVVSFLTDNNHTVTNFDGEGDFSDPTLENNFLVTEEGDRIVTEEGDQITLNV